MAANRQRSYWRQEENKRLGISSKLNFIPFMDLYFVLRLKSYNSVGLVLIQHESCYYSKFLHNRWLNKSWIMKFWLNIITN